MRLLGRLVAERAGFARANSGRAIRAADPVGAAILINTGATGTPDLLADEAPLRIRRIRSKGND